MRSILDKSFTYVPASKHSTADAFKERMQERMKKAEKERMEQAQKVSQLRKKA